MFLPIDVEDPFKDFEMLVASARQPPKKEREMLYGLVEFWSKTNARNFLAYYRKLEEKETKVGGQP